jgi:hypothetical protein
VAAETCAVAAALNVLEARFADWRADILSPFELSDAIHVFNNASARRLYVFYVECRNATCVAHALADGTLKEPEVPNYLVTKLAGLVEFYRSALPSIESCSPAV